MCFFSTEVLLKESNFKIFYKNYLAAALSESYRWLTDSWIDLSKKKIIFYESVFMKLHFQAENGVLISIFQIVELNTWLFAIIFLNPEHTGPWHQQVEKKKSIQNLGFETVQFVQSNFITKKSPHYLDNGYVFSLATLGRINSRLK